MPLEALAVVEVAAVAAVAVVVAVEEPAEAVHEERKLLASLSCYYSSWQRMRSECAVAVVEVAAGGSGAASELAEAQERLMAEEPRRPS